MSGVTDEVDPMVSGIASFVIPGLGHFLINDQPKRGLVVFLLAGFTDIMIIIVSSLLTLILIGFFGFFLLPVVHLVTAYDAYSQAQKINAGQIVP